MTRGRVLAARGLGVDSVHVSNDENKKMHNLGENVSRSQNQNSVKMQTGQKVLKNTPARCGHGKT